MECRTKAAVPVIVITGSTASGKGEAAFEAARRAGAEIIAMDSMKVYREMRIGTAKPPAGRTALVRHHLIDVVDPGSDFSVADYLALLSRALDDLALRGVRAIIAGGTPLYLKAFLEGLDVGAAADWSVRERLIAEAGETGVERLHERLRAADPAAALRIDRRDLRRIVRALEVLETTGRPLSAAWSWQARPLEPPRARVFGIAWEREELYRRIEGRVDRMVSEGLFEEAARLIARPLPLSRSASQSIGFKEIREGLLVGRPREEIIDRIKRGSRRLAKRQLTWFRKLPIEWIPASRPWSAAGVAEDVLRRSGWL
jgi:tRNA dimethylallyltransferase